MRQKVALLRLILPAQRADQLGPCRAAWLTAHGQWQSAWLSDLAQVTARFDPKRVEVCPHPADVSMTRIELPPLPAKRLRAGVHGAIELLGLGSPGDCVIGFGSQKGGAGGIQAAWMPADVMRYWLDVLQRQGLRPQAVLPPPAFLPAPETESGAAAVVLDNWLVARTGLDTGDLVPLPAADMPQDRCERKLRQAMPEIQEVRWYNGPSDMDAAGAYENASPSHDKQAYIGTGWDWKFQVGKTSSLEAPRPWLRPAIAWSVAAAAVWLIGLNLYAGRVSAQGQQVSRQMAERVKAAFPEVSVVLNPLQQARQLMQARNSGAQAFGSGEFAGLLRASTALLERSTGQVQRLRFGQGALHIVWREGAALPAGELATIQSKAQERGLGVQVEPEGLRIHVAKENGEGVQNSGEAEPAQ